jgi:hypothetical protein
MKAWRVAVCAGVVALAGCSGAHPAPHTVAMPRDGRDSAALAVVNGATAVTVGTADLGDNLIRVSTPAGSGIRPVLTGHGPVLLHLEPTGQGGPAAVRILLNPHVIWRLRFAGGTGRGDGGAGGHRDPRHHPAWQALISAGGAARARPGRRGRQAMPTQPSRGYCA